jgi:SAM-dependent methyltransferase
MKNLEYYQKIKEKTNYNFKFKSTAIQKKIKGILGTIEKDASGFFGKHKLKENFRGEKIIDYFGRKNFKNLLEIGAGDGKASLYLIDKYEKKVDLIELENSFYFKKLKSKKKFNKIIIGNFLNKKLKKYDAILCSHVLEHQENIKLFLDKIFHNLKENGYLCIIVPPRKPFIISGHVNLFNPGLLIYRLVLSKMNCKSAQVLSYDYNICIIIKKKTIKRPKLRGDIGDLDKLQKFFPFKISEGFNGDFMHVNFSKKFLKNF